MSDDRNLPATWAQRHRARARGEFPVSREWAGALTVLGSISAVAFLGPTVVARWREFVRETWAQGPALAGPGPAASKGKLLELADFGPLIWPVAGLLAWILLLAVGVHWMQSGFRFHPGRLQWQWQRLRPTLSREGGWSWAVLNTAVTMARWLVLMAVAAAGWWYARDDLFSLAATPPERWISQAGTALWQALGGVTLAIGLFCWIDRRLARIAYERRLRMSAEEVREDLQAEAIHPYVADRRRRPAPRPAAASEDAAI